LIETVDFIYAASTQHLAANIRLGWNWLTVTNTLAYHDSELTTVGKKFYVLACLCGHTTLHFLQ